VRKPCGQLHVDQVCGGIRAGGARTNLRCIAKGCALGEIEVPARAQGESHGRCEEEEEEKEEEEETRTRTRTSGRREGGGIRQHYP
jgi:hypothetical protein